MTNMENFLSVLLNIKNFIYLNVVNSAQGIFFLNINLLPDFLKCENGAKDLKISWLKC